MTTDSLKEVRSAPRSEVARWRLSFGPRRLLGSRALRYLIPIAVLLCWQLASDTGLVKPYLLPPPTVVAETFRELLIDGSLLTDISASLLRVLQGFGLAAVVGLALGMGMGLLRPLSSACDLMLQILKPIPPIAWIPLAILWLGLDEQAKIFIVFIGAVFPILFNTLDAIRQTDGRYVDLARVLEVPRHIFVTRIILPGALPQIMTGLRVGVTTAWMCVVAAELIASTNGVGYLIMHARSLAQSDVVILGMLVTGLLGKLTDDALRIVERRLVGWRETYAGV